MTNARTRKNRLVEGVEPDLQPSTYSVEGTQATPYKVGGAKSDYGHDVSKLHIEDESKANKDNKSVGEINEFEVFLEQVAHEIAYHDSLTEPDKEYLRREGYEAHLAAILYGKHGLQFLALRPIGKIQGKDSILAFRGTDIPDFEKGNIKPKETMADSKTDLNLIQIGWRQFTENQTLIEKVLHGLEDKVIMTGHSLGGSLAQMAACTYPDKTKRIVTFQSPGINEREVRKLSDYNSRARAEDRIDSTHYRVKGDVVPSFGEAMTSGNIHEFDLGLSSFVDSHRAFPLLASKFVPNSVLDQRPSLKTQDEKRSPVNEATRRAIPILASIPMSRRSLLVNGVKDGVTGLSTTLNNSMEWAITGDSTKLLEQYDKQRKGESGGILQGGTMIADAMEAVVRDDTDYFVQMASEAKEGRLGTLPTLGANLDDRALTPFSLPFELLQELAAEITGSAQGLLKREDVADKKPAEFNDPTYKLRHVLKR